MQHVRVYCFLFLILYVRGIERVSFDRFESILPGWLEEFHVGPGAADYGFEKRDKAATFYGVTDVVYALYTVNQTALVENADEFIAKINSFQEPRTGKFRRSHWEPSIFWEHAAAYGVSALKLAGGKPRYALAFIHEQNSKEKLQRFLDECLWWPIWPGSHQIAGIPAAAIAAGITPYPAYFHDWVELVNQRLDHETGFWSTEVPQTRMWQLGGAAHFYWVFHFINATIPLPGKALNTTLAVQRKDGLWGGGAPYCRDLDGLFCAFYASAAQGGLGMDRVRSAFWKALQQMANDLNDHDILFSQYENTHKLSGAIQTVAFACSLFPDMCEGSVLSWKSALAVVPWM